MPTTVVNTRVAASTRASATRGNTDDPRRRIDSSPPMATSVPAAAPPSARITLSVSSWRIMMPAERRARICSAGVSAVQISEKTMMVSWATGGRELSLL